MLYLSYGSNMNHSEMRLRCPRATYLGSTLLEKHSLVFRNVLDIVPHDNHYVPCGIWDITSQCEHELDEYEGYPVFYSKRIIEHNNSQFLLYSMHDSVTYKDLPSVHYFSRIVQGYIDCGLIEHYHVLNDAIESQACLDTYFIEVQSERKEP